MGATTSKFGFNDFGPTTVTGLVLTVKNLSKEFKIVAFGAIGFEVGCHGGATRLDRFVHDFAGGFEQIGGFFWRESAGFTSGMDSSVKERLVGINIAKAGNNGLV